VIGQSCDFNPDELLTAGKTTSCEKNEHCPRHPIDLSEFKLCERIWQGVAYEREHIQVSTMMVLFITVESVIALLGMFQEEIPRGMFRKQTVSKIDFF
jgi:hypothetical protein